jgi:hypothetical protein
MNGIKKLLGHPNTPLYMILFVLLAWFSAWAAFGPCAKRARGPHRDHHHGREFKRGREGAEAVARPGRPGGHKGKSHVKGQGPRAAGN